MFKPRSSSSDAPSAGPPPVEVVRRRARHRLIGATVLVLVGLVLLPWLFDRQPRPIPIDIALDIPSRQDATPLPLPSPVTAASGPVTGAGAALSDREELIAPRPPQVASPAVNQPPSGHIVGRSDASQPSVATPRSAESVAAPVVPKPAVQPAAKPAAPVRDDGARAKALLEGRATPAAASAVLPVSGERFIVQVGAFAEADRAQQARQTLERAGLKTYTHVADTPQGKRTRVRLGPFASRSDADKAAAKVKSLGLPAAILTL